MQIRRAELADFAEITAIYNSIVQTSTAIYNSVPSSVEERFTWWQSRLEKGFPVLVAADESGVLGYASFGEFRSWPGYRFTVEGTIHIREDSRGHGVGRQLLVRLIDEARAAGKHVMIAGVDSENAASLRFLRAFGFEPAGELREVGWKFGRYLTLNFLQYWITPKGEPPRDANREASEASGAET